MEVLFEKVEPEDIPDHREGARGRLCYPIVKSFLETGFPVAKLDQKKLGLGKTAQNLKNQINQYSSKHKLAVKGFTRAGDIYLMRLDIDFNGDPVPDWMEQTYGDGEAGGPSEDQQVKELNDLVVQQHSEDREELSR